LTDHLDYKKHDRPLAGREPTREGMLDRDGRSLLLIGRE